MPVPSTMIEFRLTMVGMPRGRVTSQQAFIITIGPIAMQRAGAGSACARTSASTMVTKPLRP